MNEIKKLRESIGLKQEHLAIYLGVERGLLSMVEIGKRELPTDSLIKLNILEQNIPKNMLSKNVDLASPELAQQEKNLQIFLQQQQQLFLQKALHLQKQLITINTNYTTAVQMLQAVRTLQQKLSNTAKNKKDLLWFAATEAMLIEKIDTNNLVVQKRLQLDIESLQYLAENI